MIPRPPTRDGVPEIPEDIKPIYGPERVPPHFPDLLEEIEKLKKKVGELKKDLKDMEGRVSKLEGYHKM
ncbi:MAG: hypothetical protein KAW09_12110 [Thermoplasmata archaeon]|nr:hypothetical protein [Thermoplasmata archaeon]